MVVQPIYSEYDIKACHRYAKEIHYLQSSFSGIVMAEKCESGAYNARKINRVQIGRASCRERV